LIRTPLLALAAALLALGAQPALAAAEEPTITVIPAVSIATLSAPEDGLPAQAEIPFSDSLNRNRISPPRPGVNVSLAGQVLPFAIVRNQFTSYFNNWPSPSLHFLATAPFKGQSFFVEFEDREMAGSATSKCGTLINYAGPCLTAGKHVGYVPVYSAREWTTEERGGARIGNTPVYAGLASFYRETNYGVVDFVAFGVGGQVLPDFSKRRSYFGRMYYYPNMVNEDDYRNPITKRLENLRFGMLRYEAGVTQKVGHSRQYVEAAIDGNNEWRLVNGPGGSMKLKLVLGSGFRF
jgi:hypothetical protein